MEYKDIKNMEEVDVKYHVKQAWWLSSRATAYDGICNSSQWMGFWHYRYDNGEVTCLSQVSLVT
jgi:hypothetical protein